MSMRQRVQAILRDGIQAVRNTVASKHRAEFARALRDGDFEVTPGGILLRGSARLSGRWIATDGNMVQEGHNLYTAQGLGDALDVVFGAQAKRNWYIGFYANAVNPAFNWTAANWVATAGENTSTSEGWAGANRLAYTVTGAATVSNSESRASVTNNRATTTITVVATTTITLNGAAVCSAQARGATTGVLASAMRFPYPWTLPNEAEFGWGYELAFVDA
ncbi:MAG: hypothetical protein E6Q97_03835 [Desulfurellales bacterium]|nr:MAG: hypothetical protein E6Q97_03835 [Desulfurellales bacterium]